jgi:hypothetical protein
MYHLELYLQWDVVAESEVSERQYTCSGTLVRNADGTTSCVTQIGVSSTGYPIYKVNRYTITSNLVPTSYTIKFLFYFYSYTRFTNRSPTWTLALPVTWHRPATMLMASPFTAWLAPIPWPPTSTPARALWWQTATAQLPAWPKSEPRASATPFTL